MTTRNLTAKAQVAVDAPVSSVWNALTNPSTIKKYMMGTTVQSEWKRGSKITWKGEFKGKSYEDKGQILHIEPGKELQYSHFSGMSGVEDKAENYHIVTIDLAKDGNKTVVNLSQDNNTSKEALEESQKNWTAMLQGLKKTVEEEK